MRKRLDEQKSLNELADAKSNIISDALLAERHHKLEAFARSSKSRVKTPQRPCFVLINFLDQFQCRDKPVVSSIGWRELLEKKQKFAEEKLSTYRSWTPWAVSRTGRVSSRVRSVLRAGKALYRICSTGHELLDESSNRQSYPQ